MKLFESQMRFGMFTGTYHKPGKHPTVSIRQDIEIIQQLDRLGFDEVWVGEHHSSGVSPCPSPELLLAGAAERTERIKLGTGVVSLPYHHPLMVADRITQLSHQSKGRAMLGIGPGALLRDAQMIGLDPLQSRRIMEEALDVIIRLLKGKTVNFKNERFELNDARLQVLPHSDFDIATVSVLSPAGPKLAGKYGTGMISVAATDPQGIERLAGHWEIWKDEAAAAGHAASRDDWRMMGPMHIAETEEQARAEVKYALKEIETPRYLVNPGPFPDFDNLDKVIDDWNEAGAAVIGTPEMAIAQINRVVEKSGGFGTFLFMGHNWANFPATMRSWELLAEEVLPVFQGQTQPLLSSYDDVLESGKSIAEVNLQAQTQYIEQYAAEKQ